MLKRCNNKLSQSYKDYGGRGIKSYKRWDKFENFLEDMNHPSSKDLSLDRIDNNKGYYKENCRWATIIEQNNNSRHNRYFYIDNEKLTMKQVSEKYKVNYSTLKNKINRLPELTIQEVLTYYGKI